MNTDDIIPDKVRGKAEEILKSEAADGEKIVIRKEEDGIFYSYIDTNRRGLGSAYIDGNDLSFLWGSSSMNPSTLLEEFKKGRRSPEHREEKRHNVRLPVISEDSEILNFADKAANTFIGLFDKQDDPNDPLKDDWYRMIYNGIALLLSARKNNTKLIYLTVLYHHPELVKTYLKNVRDKEVYEYWTMEVPDFMRNNTAAANLIHYFDLRIASLIGEQEIQDLCRNH